MGLCYNCMHRFENEEAGKLGDGACILPSCTASGMPIIQTRQTEQKKPQCDACHQPKAVIPMPELGCRLIISVKPDTLAAVS